MADVVSFPQSSLGDDIPIEPDVAVEPAPASWAPGRVVETEIELEVTELEVEPELPLEIEPEPAAAGSLDPAVISTALIEVLPADFQLPLLTKFIPNPALRTALHEAVQQALAVEVAAPHGLERADVALSAIHRHVKTIEEHFEEPTRVAYDLHRRLTGLRSEWSSEGKDAIKVMARRIFDEHERQHALEREARRREQEEADRQAREAAQREAAQAEAANVPAPIVEEMKQQAQTVTAPPVSAGPGVSSVLRNNSTTRTWKARIAGTSGDAEDQQPCVEALSAPQRAKVLETMKAVLEGRAPLAVFEINWSYLDKRAKADKSAMGIPGFEAFQVGGVRAKGRRS